MLRFTDVDRRRARCEDRIRCARDTGLRSLPLHGFARNQAWCELVALACDLLAWTLAPPRRPMALDPPSSPPPSTGSSASLPADQQ